jgi:hypothetical protein
MAVPSRRPVSAFALSLASGILIVVCALILLLIRFPWIFALVGLVSGTITLFASVLMYARPKEHAIWGVLVLVFACVGIVSFGGFIAGMVLGIIGGALGIAWRPEGTAYGTYAPTPVYGGYGGVPATGGYAGGFSAGPYGVPMTPWRMCMGCGRWIPWSYNVCPLCGTQTPVASWLPRATDTPPVTAPPIAGPYGTPPPTPVTTPMYSMPAPAYTTPQAPTAPRPKEPCPTCTGEAEWNAAVGRWFCPAESKYF